MSADEADGDVARLYDRLGVSLYRYALMILGRHDAAEDAVQQVFVAVVRDRGARIRDPEPYLRRAVRNTCYSKLRSPAPVSGDAPSERGRPLLELLSGEAPGQPGLEDRLALEAAISQLPPEQREVLHLHVFEGLTFKEVADATGESANTAASRYRYALERLRVLLTAHRADTRR
jgi:RNA polymerase sigma-70 factor (ECF subfamily)